MASKCNGIKSEINSKKIKEKSLNSWKLNNPFGHNLWIKEDISEEQYKMFLTEKI